MLSLVHEFCVNLFSSEQCSLLNEVLNAIPRKFDDEMNEVLAREYTNEESKYALFQMGPTKASRPYGFSAIFYQRHRYLLEQDLCSAVRGFLMGQTLQMASVTP